MRFIIDVVVHFDLPSYMNILLHHVNIYIVVYHMDYISINFHYLNTIVVKLYNNLNIILITKNIHIAVIIFHYELHVPYALQFKYLYPFYVEFKS